MWIVANVVAPLLLAGPALPQGTPWSKDPLFQQIAGRLDSVRAIDNHTHLLAPGAFQPQLDALMPLGLRSTHPGYAEALSARFGVTVAPGALAAASEKATAVRAALIEEKGAHGYWMDHLDFTGTDIALVNQDRPEGTDGRRLRWVPHATNLLYPLPAESLMARSPRHREDIARIQTQLKAFLGEGDLAEVPPDLAGYVGFLEGTLARWKRQGAVAVKLWDAYLRTLVFEDVPEETARTLYAKGRTAALSRDEYVAVQDFLARRIFLKCGELKLPVHIHSSHGVPPFLRLSESDVRNLEPVLTDVRYFGTTFVLIHGGAPLVEAAAYLSLKPHVWYDMSAMTSLYPVPELGEVLRKVLTFAPEKLLFSTDVSGYPGVPVGPEVQHVVLSRSAREALYLALAGLVRDGVVDLETAVTMGAGVLRHNAERLYGWGPP